MSTRRPLIALIAADVASLSGTRLAMIAIPWLVLTLTDSPMLTGVTAFTEMAPYVVAKALGGPLIDRLGARKVAVAGDLASIAALGAIPLLSALGLLQIAVLLPVVFLMGLLRGPVDAAKQALVPAVAEAGNLPLERVTGLVATADRLATTLGAGAAGGLVAWLGPAPALGLGAVAFGFSALAIFSGLPSQSRSPAGESKGYWRELREGWQVLRGDAVLVGFVLMIAVTNLLDQAFTTVLLPVWARDVGGNAGLIGILIAVQSAFAVVGALTASALGERLPRLRIYTIAFLVGGPTRFLAFLPGVPLPAAFAVLGVAGFAIGFINPIISAVSFERIPKEMTGRVFSLITACAWVLMPFGGLLAGAAIARLGLPASFALAGAAYLAATMTPLFAPGFRALDSQREAPRAAG